MSSPIAGAPASRVPSAARSVWFVTIVCNVGNYDLYNPAHYARHLPDPKAMRDLARLYAQIALLKRGPQDLPASTLLLAITVLAYFTINLVVSLALPGEPGPWLAILLVDVVFTLDFHKYDFNWFDLIRRA